MNQAFGAFDVMGVYERSDGANIGVTVTQEGQAYKTVSEHLFGCSYDAVRSAALNLPANVNGGAFLNPNGNTCTYFGHERR